MTNITSQRVVDADHPWLGLTPYSEETREFFFGRDAEVRDLFLRVREQPLTILYGQSGLGKTSLLGAGLIPKLRVEGLRLVLLRLGYEPTDPPLIEQVFASVAFFSDQERPSAEQKATMRPLTLWERFHHIATRPTDLADSPPVLIFDQFEEIFTLTTTKERQAEALELFRQLADLIENRPPQAVQERLRSDRRLARDYDLGPSPVRVVITLREDFLSHLEAYKKLMPSLMRNRMALQMLNGPQALEAVVRPGRLQGRNLVSDEVGGRIVRFVANQPPETPLEKIGAVPPLLSLLCDELNEVRLTQNQPMIAGDGGSLGGIETLGQNILDGFYSRSFADLHPAVRTYVEDRMVTIGGHRNPIAFEDALAELTVAGVANPADAINQLVRGRLLCVEDRSGTQRLEITHDVLAPLVAHSRDNRRERLQTERQKRRFTLTLVSVALASIVAFAIVGLIAKEYRDVAKRSLENAQIKSEDQAIKAQLATKRAKFAQQVAEQQKQLAWEIASISAKLTSPEVLSQRLRSEIRLTAENKIKGIDNAADRSRLVAEIENERDAALGRVDDLINSIDIGLEEGTSPAYERAVQILQSDGTDTALAYLTSCTQSTLDEYRRRSKAIQDEARAEKEKLYTTLRPLALECDLQEARMAWHQALSIREQLVDIAPDWFVAQSKLGNLYVTLGRFDEAEPHLLAAIDLTTDPNDQAEALNSLASLLLSLNRLAEAEPLLRRALTISDRDASVARQSNVSDSLNNLAVLMVGTNRLNEAESLIRRALEINEKVLGSDSPHVSVSLNNLATLLNANGRPAEAIELMQRALKIDEAAYGRVHPTVARDLNLLGQLLIISERKGDAEVTLLEALSIEEKVLGPKHPNVARNLRELSSLYANDGRVETSESFIQRAIEIDKVAFGEMHPTYMADLTHLAKLYQATNRLEQAEPLLRHVLEIITQSIGPDKPSVADALSNLSDLLQAMSRPSDSEPLMRRALAISASTLGSEHPKSITRNESYVKLLVSMNLDEDAVVERVRRVIAGEDVGDLPLQ